MAVVVLVVLVVPWSSLVLVRGTFSKEFAAPRKYNLSKQARLHLLPANPTQPPHNKNQKSAIKYDKEKVTPRNRKLIMHNEVRYVTMRTERELPLLFTPFMRQILLGLMARAAEFYPVTSEDCHDAPTDCACASYQYCAPMTLDVNGPYACRQK